MKKKSLMKVYEGFYESYGSYDKAIHKRSLYMKNPDTRSSLYMKVLIEGSYTWSFLLKVLIHEKDPFEGSYTWSFFMKSYEVLILYMKKILLKVLIHEGFYEKLWRFLYMKVFMKILIKVLIHEGFFMKILIKVLIKNPYTWKVL